VSVVTSVTPGTRQPRQFSRESVSRISRNEFKRHCPSRKAVLGGPVKWTYTSTLPAYTIILNPTQLLLYFAFLYSFISLNTLP